MSANLFEEPKDERVMRQPCPHCDYPTGSFTERNGQMTVTCMRCERHCYNAPKAETGEVQRSTRSRPNIKPSLRGRVLERDNYRCTLCGRAQGILHIGHLISVTDGRQLEMPEDELYSFWNLATFCEECNLGQGSRTVSPLLQYRLFCIWRKAHPDAE